jgi:hypothetical protein
MVQTSPTANGLAKMLHSPPTKHNTLWIGVLCEPRGACNDLDLSLHRRCKLGAVLPVDEQAEVATQPSASFDPTRVVLRIDDPDAGRRDDDVIDVRARPGDPAVVQRQDPTRVQAVEQRADVTLAASPLLPRTDRLRFAAESQSNPSGAGMPRQHGVFAPLTTAFALHERRAAGNTAIGLGRTRLSGGRL